MAMVTTNSFFFSRPRREHLGCMIEFACTSREGVAGCIQLATRFWDFRFDWFSLISTCKREVGENGSSTVGTGGVGVS